MIVLRGEVYLDESHVEALKSEPEYVRERYRAATKTLAPEPFGITREKAAEMIKRSLRQLYRILKRFLRHQLGSSRNRAEINKWVKIYNAWYNNGKYHSAIDTYPEERYSGQRNEKWYERLVKALKLENILAISPQSGDISP